MQHKAISGEEYTQPAGLFVHFLRCKKGYIAHTMRPFLRLENEQKFCAIWVYSFLEIA